MADADGSEAKRRKTGEGPPELEVRTYIPTRILGKGSFGVVYMASVQETGETVAIKSVKVSTNGDGRYRQMSGDKDREVQVLKELDGHPNIVCLRGCFLTAVPGQTEGKLNLVLEYLSDTLHRVLKHYNAQQRTMDQDYVKLYLYQLFRGLGFIHGRGIVHCDIKPQNLLLDGRTHKLKICDFGTAKRLVFGKPNASYICSRYYRAPELILGSSNYTTSVDLWSGGAVFGELLLGQPMFTGTDGINQLVEIIKVLGTPTTADLKAMNPNYPDYEFKPTVAPHPWDKVFRGQSTKDANELAGFLLRYDPASRLPPMAVLQHGYFNELRFRKEPELRFLFEFRPDELWWCSKKEVDRLVPRWFAALQKEETAA